MCLACDHPVPPGSHLPFAVNKSFRLINKHTHFTPIPTGQETAAHYKPSHQSSNSYVRHLQTNNCTMPCPFELQKSSEHVWHTSASCFNKSVCVNVFTKLKILIGFTSFRNRSLKALCKQMSPDVGHYTKKRIAGNDDACCEVRPQARWEMLASGRVFPKSQLLALKCCRAAGKQQSTNSGKWGRDLERTPVPTSPLRS